MPDVVALLVMAPVIPACVAAWASVRSARIVSGNGRGNVAEMVEEVLEWKAEHTLEHRFLEARVARTSPEPGTSPAE